MKKTDDIMQTLANGVQETINSDRYKEYLDVMSRFYRYSANNCLLILMQYPEATQVAGFKTWKDKFNRNVKKGEKAIKILAPCPHKKIVERDGEETEVTFTTFHPVNVFDVSQTEGKDLPEICKELTATVDGCNEIIAKLKDFAPVPVTFDNVPGGAKGYYSHDGKIVVQSGMSEAQTIKTLIHEIAHSILHCAGGLQESATREEKETQAESIAFVVCNALGINTESYSFDYLASWAGGKDAKALLKSMSIIKTTADKIVAAIA